MPLCSTFACAILVVAFKIVVIVGLPAPALGQRLEGIAVLPADAFTSGPTSGQFIEPANGRRPPFETRQPVQGFSSLLPAPGDRFLALADNGFGAPENSADCLLRFHRLAPDFGTAAGGSGTIAIEASFTLRDPQRRIGFPIVADSARYPGSAIPVDPAIRKGRLLTGADLDVESFRAAPDGTLWFGDEFGPFLIHTDRSGKVLEPPFALPGVRSPQHPAPGGEPANLPRSRGLEGMAIAPDGTTLYPMLEGALTTDPDRRRLMILEFDLGERRWTERRWFYRLEPDTVPHQIGDLTAVTGRSFLVVERDDLEGARAGFKKIYRVSLDEADSAGFLIKREVVDLLAIDDPDGLAGSGPRLRYDFQCIESVIVLGPTRLGVINDNNYPFSSARVPGAPDPSEFILIGLDRPLD